MKYNAFPKMKPVNNLERVLLFLNNILCEPQSIIAGIGSKIHDRTATSGGNPIFKIYSTRSTENTAIIPPIMTPEHREQK